MTTCIKSLCVLFALAFLSCAGLTSAAQAIPTAFVSPVSGADDADCGAATPCKSLADALVLVDPGGVIVIQEPALFSPIIISKSVEIIAVTGVVFQGLTISISSLNVKIRGVSFNGATVNGSTVAVRNASKLSLFDCYFTMFTGRPAITVNSPAGARVALEGVRITNSQYGVVVEGQGGAANSVFIKDSFIDGSTMSAVEVRGAGGSAVLVNSTLAGSFGPDLSVVNGGRAISYGNNVIRSGSPTQTLPNN